MGEIRDPFRPTGDYHAERDDQHVAVVTSAVDVDGQSYRPGDRVTPRYAREHKIPHVVTTDRPRPETK